MRDKLSRYVYVWILGYEVGEAFRPRSMIHCHSHGRCIWSDKYNTMYNLMINPNCGPVTRYQKKMLTFTATGMDYEEALLQIQAEMREWS